MPRPLLLTGVERHPDLRSWETPTFTHSVEGQSAWMAGRPGVGGRPRPRPRRPPVPEGGRPPGPSFGRRSGGSGRRRKRGGSADGGMTVQARRPERREAPGVGRGSGREEWTSGAASRRRSAPCFPASVAPAPSGGRNGFGPASAGACCPEVLKGAGARSPFSSGTTPLKPGIGNAPARPGRPGAPPRPGGRSPPGRPRRFFPPQLHDSRWAADEGRRPRDPDGFCLRDLGTHGGPPTKVAIPATPTGFPAATRNPAPGADPGAPAPDTARTPGNDAASIPAPDSLPAAPGLRTSPAFPSRRSPPPSRPTRRTPRSLSPRGRLGSAPPTHGGLGPSLSPRGRRPGPAEVAATALSVFSPRARAGGAPRRRCPASQEVLSPRAAPVLSQAAPASRSALSPRAGGVGCAGCAGSRRFGTSG